MELRERFNETKDGENLENLRREFQGSIHQIEEIFETLSDENIVLSYLRYIYVVKLNEDVANFGH